jgi:pilus assembly protein CpaE
MQHFETREGLTEKIKIVVNRFGLEDTQISLTKALETIGREIYWQIPNDFATMVEARNNGIPLCMQAPRAKITRSLEQLAQQLDTSANPKAEEERKPRKGLFSFLGSGGR